MIDWLRDAVEVHVHPSPSMFPRLLDDDELAAAAEAAGMYAVLFKAHEGYTMERAALAQKRCRRLKVLGGVVLNHFVGGLNPHAVAYALTMGARMVWMPTMHSANHIRWRGSASFGHQQSGMEHMTVEPLTVLDERGRLRPAVQDILELMAGRDAALGAGHLHRDEIAVLFREARARGVERLIVTHAELPFMECDVAFQAEMARLGVYIERSWLAVTHPDFGIDLARTAAEIREIGPGQVVLETDFGQATNPAPTEGLAAFCAGLHAHGLSEADVRRMVSTNPAALLNLPAP